MQNKIVYRLIVNRELDHPNIVKFVGGCVTLPHIALITEYCPKGSLADVLLNDDVPLNWSFRYSIPLFVFYLFLFWNFVFRHIYANSG